jgi:hypothetical protein
MVLGATNQPWELDDGIKRRFQKRIFIPLPGTEERRALLQLQLRSVVVGADVDVDALVARLEGYSGADIRTVCQAAALAPLERLTAEVQARFGQGTGFAQANLLLCGPDDQDCDGSPAPLDCNDLDAAITGPCPPDCTAPAFDPMLVSASASAVDCASASRTIELVIKNEGTADLDGSLSIALFGVAPGASATPFHVLALGDMTGTLPIVPGATGTFSYTLPDPLPTGVTDLWVVLNHGSTTSFVSDGAAGFKSAGVTAECQTEDNMSGALSCLSTGGACTTPSDCAASDTCDTVDCIGGVCTTIEDLTLQTCEENNVVYVTVTNGTQIGFVRCEKTLAGISCDVDGDGKLLVTPGSGGVCAP